MGAILKRELGAYFSSATAYVVMAVYFFFSGLFFNFYCISANSSSLSYVYGNMFYIILFLIPIITMKTFAEEKKQKSDQALLTAPTSLTEIVLGKFLGAFCLYAICCCIFLVYAVVISFFASPEWSVILCTFIGILLLGGSLIAINVFISVMTESMVVAAVIGMGVGLVISMTNYLISLIQVDWIKNILNKINFLSYYENFTYGILSIVDVVFFLSVTALFLFFTVRVLEKRRWS
ncbi:MAG: ABC transporter permease subunit [Ruminococcus sp.]|jgi:ABC-2 type transport system permease protein|nr:ABC transporter permease subunit [Ruminococcus sp.]MBQ7745763.1 ABC transporter permease subunit [Ruminococcus sp.]MDO4882030.1 ABC transporter permease subunit [Oscillospiraceae bacterium]MEE1016543.1 ABC transporter permease subunit [Ruminococcus sp.]